ncbi:prepilin-type N-terminal cleavage/methylation domain-containing protein [Rugamonas sp. CCM 8940]|uniref:type IV pilus modification PilV family protein n=1 Tax=Rugamonas sp. CCM 8940 TaxID=2765359 RepID=UPI0018F534EE|nr:prepilin-type N-terminal cleavage/methylation domain-containing protein [Rugamonas sp. CCM 8940]MBJ7313585.1 type II secretion system protein [Rugamonas sp. CCM 8940]
MSFNPPGRQRGLSIIELIIFIVVMGIAAAGIMQVFNLSTKASADPVRRKQALLLAEALLEEIELARFTYCDPTDANAATATSAVNGGAGNPLQCFDKAEGFGLEAGNVGRPFDNVNDYVTGANAVSTPFTVGGVLVDAAGIPFEGDVAGFTANVTMNVPGVAAPLGPAALPVRGNALAANLNAVRITVTVNYGSPNDNVTLDGYRTRYAPTSYP